MIKRKKVLLINFKTENIIGHSIYENFKTEKVSIIDEFENIIEFIRENNKNDIKKDEKIVIMNIIDLTKVLS